MTTAHSGSGDLARSLDLLWHGPSRPARGPKPTLSLDKIVTAAVSLADREGVRALSMRCVAMELGVGTMSLYRYVPGKGELLDLMLDHVARLPEDAWQHRGENWRAAMERLARSTWQLYHAHPWLLHVNQARPLLGPNALAAFDFTVTSFDGLPLTSQEKVAIVMAVDHYATGTARTYLLQQQVREQSGMSDEEFWKAQEPTVMKAIESGDYPQVAQLNGDAFSMTGTEVLEFGLGPLLDGLAAFITAKSASKHRP